MDECARWLARLASDEKAVRQDLVDLNGFMLGTGVRIGEALGVAWDEVDLVGVDMLVNGALRRTYTVKIDWTICRVKGRPLFRKGTKTAAGSRTLRLPEFVVAMLARRAAEMYVLATGVLPVGDFVHPTATSPAPHGQNPPRWPEESRPGDTSSRRVTRRGSPDTGDDFQGDSVHMASGYVSAAQRLSGEDFGHFGHAFRTSECVPIDGHVLAGAVDAAAAVTYLTGSPVFPDTRGGWRDPANTRRALRNARGTEEFAWVTSHVFRKTAATMLDEAGLTARQIADQLGQARPSLTQDVYMARGVADPRAATALEQGLSQVFPMHKPSTDRRNKSQDLA